ncbi:MAG: B12-binding domain-containing radical SAM protein [Candidatus Omnitrophica bacterium]|nr:B12-binding domain-containing radical SAM protein [Candidatus Omnitrophota bacterium]
MRVLLIRPPKYLNGGLDTDTFNYAQPPVGIASISAFLRSKGVDTEVLDLYFEGAGAAKQKLRNISAGLVGVTCISGEHQNALDTAQFVKDNVKPAPFVVLGGPHVTVTKFDELILNSYPFVDFIIREEGEISNFELIEALEGKRDLDSVKGLSFRRNGRYTYNPDRPMLSNLDALPLPDYSFYDFSKNIGGNYDGHFFFRDVKSFKFAPIVSSRGCPNRCQFCSLFWGNNVRMRSAENVVEEIMALMRQFGIRHFSFFDDCFNISLERIEKFCQLVIERRLNISWTAMMRVKPVNSEILKTMNRAGCRGLCFGVESGSNRLLKSIKKNIDTNEITRAFSLAREAGIMSKMLLMVGNMGETAQSIKESQLLIRRCKPTTVGISPLVVLPNSDVYNSLLAKGKMDDTYWFTHSRAPIYTEEHSYDVLRYYRFKLLGSFYVSTKGFFKLLKVFILKFVFLILIKMRIEADSVKAGLHKYPWMRSLLGRFRTVD